MTKNILISALVGSIVIFILGALFYAMLFADFFTSNIPEGMEIAQKTEPNLGLIYLGNLAAGLLLAYIFENLAGIRTFAKGAIAGMIIGLLIGLYFDLIFLATTNLGTPVAAAVDVIISAIMFAIAGGVIAALLGKLNKS